MVLYFDFEGLKASLRHINKIYQQTGKRGEYNKADTWEVLFENCKTKFAKHCVI